MKATLQYNASLLGHITTQLMRQIKWIHVVTWYFFQT